MIYSWHVFQQVRKDDGYCRYIGLPADSNYADSHGGQHLEQLACRIHHSKTAMPHRQTIQCPSGTECTLSTRIRKKTNKNNDHVNTKCIWLLSVNNEQCRHLPYNTQLINVHLTNNRLLKETIYSITGHCSSNGNKSATCSQVRSSKKGGKIFINLISVSIYTFHRISTPIWILALI